MSDGFVRKKVESLTLGEKLIKLRSQYRMSLAEISKATRIQAKYLEALESGDYRGLPAEVYVRGFLRSYARYLGLEDDAFVKLYDKEKHIRTHLGQTVTERKQSSAAVLQQAWVVTPRTLALVAMAVILLGTFWYLFRELQSFVAEPRLVITSPTPDTVTSEGVVAVTGETDPGAQVNLNGEPLFVNTTGGFQELLTLQPGANTLRISATNRFDKTKETVIVVENSAVPAQPEADFASVELSVARKVERVSIELDGVVVWNGSWDPSKQEAFPVKAGITIVTSDPGSTLLRRSSALPEPLEAGVTEEKTYTYTRENLLASPESNTQNPAGE